MSDYRFFTECLDTSVPELSSIADIAREGKNGEAIRLFAAYVRRSLHPEIFLKGEKERLMPYAEAVAADSRRVMEHTFVSCRVPHTFGETIDWTANPTYNNYCEWPWQLNRHPEWKMLAKNYILTNDESIPAEWSRQFMSWVVQAQVPQDVSCQKSSCWRTLEAGIRINVWLYVIHSFLNAIEDETLTVFCKSIWEHGWILRSFCTRNNWLIMEMMGLSGVGLFFPFLKDSAGWLAYALGRLKEEFGVQLYPDGAQHELTPSYQYCCIEDYEDVVSMIRLHGDEVPRFLTDGLDHMYSLYPKIAAPDFRTPAVNDSFRERVQPILKRGMRNNPERTDFLYFVSDRAEGRPPEYLSLLLEYSGMVIFRSSWEKDAIWAYMDASPFGARHQHEDKLNVLMWAYGHELMPDAGNFDYDTSEMRAYTRSTRGHNTARIDGCDQNTREDYAWHPEDINKKADVTFKTDDRRETAEAAFEKGYGPDRIPVVHRRKLIFLKNEPSLPPMFVCVDRFLSDGEHSGELLWHLHDNPTTADSLCVNNTYPDGVGLTVASSYGGIEIVRGMKTPEFQGWLPNFGVGDVEHFPIPTIRNTFRLEGRLRIVTVLCPYQGGKAEVRAIEASPDCDAKNFCIVLSDGQRITIEE